MAKVTSTGADIISTEGLGGLGVLGGTQEALGRVEGTVASMGGPFGIELGPIMKLLMSSPAFAAQLGQIGKSTNVLQSSLAQKLGTTAGGTTGIGKTASAIGQSAGGFAAAQARGAQAKRAEDIALRLLLARMASEAGQGGDEGGGLLQGILGLGGAFLGGLPGALFNTAKAVT